MNQVKVSADRGAVESGAGSSVYVPSLEITKGQPPPIAANEGLSYMSFDRDGDSGTAAATEAAFAQIEEGAGQAIIDMIDSTVIHGINPAI